MNTWIPVAIAIAVNIIAIAVAYGKLTQTVDNLKERMGMADAAKIRNNERTEKWEQRIEDKSLRHLMIPECMNEFAEINKQLGSLSGKVDALLALNGGCKKDGKQ
jgi:flagellar basal body P-ring protein FlgI